MRILADGQPVTGREMEKLSPRAILPAEWEEHRRRFGWEPNPSNDDAFEADYARAIQAEWSD